MCAEINEGYVERLSRLVSFNGQRVVNMAHLQTLVDTALEVHHHHTITESISEIRLSPELSA